MREKILRITDKSGNIFRMKISTPDIKRKVLAGASDLANGLPVVRYLPDYTAGGSWAVLDEGFVKYRSGPLRPRASHNGDLTTRDLLVLGDGGLESYDRRDLFGMQLFEYEDAIGVNKKGEGFVIQPWVVAATPGRISWKVIG